MQEELIAIRSMVSQVLERQPPSGPSDDLPHLPQHLLDMYVRLIGQDLSEDLADQVVRGVRDELDDEQLADESKVRTAVLRHLARIVPVTPDAAYEPNADGRPVVIAMVGPTGVGKTTTLAKLAATFKLHHHLRVGLITADTYRIAAVEQLRTYANIIGLPLEVVLTPVQMREALDRLADRRSLDGGGCDVILIDTAGRSQNDTGRIDELRKFVEAAKPDQVHLVLSSTAGERVLLREAEAFSPLGIHRIVLTKLDEAVSFGMLINVIRKVGKQLSFVTTGQEVPEHPRSVVPEEPSLPAFSCPWHAATDPRLRANNPPGAGRSASPVPDTGSPRRSGAKPVRDPDAGSRSADRAQRACD
jgi:flagellar biosynthesis protein FlhF